MCVKNCGVYPLYGTKDLSPEVQAIFIRNASHCQDTNPPDETDSDEIIQVRQKIAKLIGVWLSRDTSVASIESSISWVINVYNVAATYANMMFANRVVANWNSLPHEIRTATSVNSFKNQYDLYRSSMTS